MSKSKFLKSVDQKDAIVIKKGLKAHNYKELAADLRFLSDEEFKTIREKNPNLILYWILKNFKDDKLIFWLNKAKTRKQHIYIIEKRIRKLEEKKPFIITTLDSATYVFPTRKGIVFFMLGLILLNILIFNFLYTPNPQNSIEEQANKMQQLIITQRNELINRNEEIYSLNRENEELKNKINDMNNKHLVKLKLNSPEDRISLEDINVETDKLTLNYKELLLAEFEDTGSMKPVLDIGSTAIQIIPQSQDELQVGDIISYEFEEKIVIHRIQKISYDFSGWYALTKGDNNEQIDENKVRFSQIKRVVIGILY